ncbi:methyltransferase domain-containing protein [Pseudomonas paralcaligenes]|uniref:methyltransferase domain-containing protein n=1 Tax=Pseudomonas paralcaligenes TaxID=2772558 RepID=UPI001C7F5BCC|nr:methyltransferase domain-containing protein [Pseudomonas paralcaligenes]
MSQPAERLAHSWQLNAEGWTRAVREGRIESRRLVTDAAIIEAALALRPRRALDIGCGEGWLCRALAERGVAMSGVDASPALVATAHAAGGADYRVCSHAGLTGAGLGRFDLLLCNFALLDEHLPLRDWRELFEPGGRLLIQTLHPRMAGDPYMDGWRLERFEGFGAGFVEPMPWYFRTLESWLDLLADAGWTLEKQVEPPHPQTGKPASLLLQAV